MEARTETKPLDRFPIIRTDDVDETKAAFQGFYGELYLSVFRDFDKYRAYGNHCQLNDIGISYMSYSAPVRKSYPNFTPGYAIPIAIAGSGWGKTADKTFAVTGKETLISSPELPAALHCDLGLENITVVIDAAAVKRKLASLVGADIRGKLIFDPHLSFDNPTNGLWWRLIKFLIAEAETQKNGVPLTALSEIEEALIVMLLKANRHNFSHLLDSPESCAAPRQVRLAEAFIEAHWDQAITVELLTQHTSVSARSLFHSFRQARGYSPMAFVKQVRLRHARRMLLTAEPGTTVAAIAYKCGFGNLGNFARDYRKAFGELPSHTIRSH